METRILNLKVTSEEHRRIEELATAEEITMSDLVRRLCWPVLDSTNHVKPGRRPRVLVGD